jgi:mRNA interferase RelE/StbE
MYAIKYRKAATKGLRKLPARTGKKIVDTLKKFAADPRGYRGDWKPMSGSTHWRLRVGRYRAICELREQELILLVLNVGARGDVYK